MPKASSPPSRDPIQVNNSMPSAARSCRTQVYCLDAIVKHVYDLDDCICIRWPQDLFAGPDVPQLNCIQTNSMFPACFNHRLCSAIRASTNMPKYVQSEQYRSKPYSIATSLRLNGRSNRVHVVRSARWVHVTSFCS